MTKCDEGDCSRRAASAFVLIGCCCCCCCYCCYCPAAVVSATMTIFRRPAPTAAVQCMLSSNTQLPTPYIASGRQHAVPRYFAEKAGKQIDAAGGTRYTPPTYGSTIYCTVHSKTSFGHRHRQGAGYTLHTNWCIDWCIERGSRSFIASATKTRPSFPEMMYEACITVAVYSSSCSSNMPYHTRQIAAQLGT